MTENWEGIFKQWATPPGRDEERRCENAIRAIRNAIDNSPKLKHRSIKIFPQGSYRNRVNVRQDSDVDVGVLCDDSFIPYYPSGTTRATFGNTLADYQYGQFKNEVEEALIEHFGAKAVCRGNKAIDVRESSYHVDADVVPFFEYRHYRANGDFYCGVALRPDNGGKIHNYPERLLDTWPQAPLHYENGVSKNKHTHRSYKGVVRILKKVRHEMEESNIDIAQKIPGFLIECMVWNAPNEHFKWSTWEDKAQAVLQYLWSNLQDGMASKDWCEVNDIKFLFHSTQPWTRREACIFVSAAWTFLGMR